MNKVFEYSFIIIFAILMTVISFGISYLKDKNYFCIMDVGKVIGLITIVNYIVCMFLVKPSGSQLVGLIIYLLAILPLVIYDFQMGHVPMISFIISYILAYVGFTQIVGFYAAFNFFMFANLALVGTIILVLKFRTFMGISPKTMLVALPMIATLTNFGSLIFVILAIILPSYLIKMILVKKGKILPNGLSYNVLIFNALPILIAIVGITPYFSQIIK